MKSKSWERARQLFLLLLLALPFSSPAQTPADTATLQLRLSGVEEVAPLLRAAGVPESGRLNRADLPAGMHRLLAALRDRQHYAAQIDSVILHPITQAGRAEALLQLSPGPRFELMLHIHARDSTAMPPAWQREFHGVRREAEWAARLHELLGDFARAGRPLAALNLDSVLVQAPVAGGMAQAELHYTLDPGPLVRLDSILIRGNKMTKTPVLSRELPVRPGDTFQLDKVQSIPDRLLRLGYLQAVAPPELRRDARGRHVLDITVTEGNSNVLNAVAGYNPGSGNQKGYLTGTVDLKFANLFGTGRLLNARWEKRSVETQELGLRYREPWVAGYPLHLSGGFQQVIQDTLYVKRAWELAFELPLGSRFTLLGALSRETISPDSLAALRFLLPRSQTTSLSAGLQFDTRNDLVNPRSGFHYATTVSSGRKQVRPVAGGDTQTFARKQLNVDLQWLIPTFWPQVASFALHGREVTSGESTVAVTDQMRFGGATTLRGYREEQFRGSRVAWMNVEYRYLLSRRSRAFVFLDAGYYFRTEAEAIALETGTVADGFKTVEAVKMAYGGGVRMDTPLGIVGVDYGIGEGDDPLNGKVHLSLLNHF